LKRKAGSTWGFISGFCGLNVRFDLTLDIFVNDGRRLLSPLLDHPFVFIYTPKILQL